MTNTSSTPSPPRKERRLGFVAGLSIVIGVGMLTVSAFWPSIMTERAVVAGGVAAVPTSPANLASEAAATTTTIPGVVDRLATTTTSTTQALPASSTSTTTTFVVPSSTIALPPFTEAPLPPVSVPLADRTPRSPIVVAVPYGLTDMNPHVVSQLPNDNAAIMSEVLPSPFRTGGRGEAILDQNLMAEAPKVISVEPLTIDYRIRNDAKWSDGEPIGCDDFRLAALSASGRFSVKLANGAVEPVFHARTVPGYAHASIVCEGPKRIFVTIQPAEPDWKWLFGSLTPAHAVMAAAKVTDLNTLDTDNAAVLAIAKEWNNSFGVAKELPVGSLSGGPFRVSLVTPQGVLLETNDKYWGAAPAAPAGILIKTVPASAQLDALRNGSVQVIGLPADASTLDALKAGSGSTVVRSAPVALTELLFNFKNGFLQNRTLRQAVSACIDRKSLVTGRVVTVLPEATIADNRMLGPNDPGYRSTSGTPPTGAERARALLTQSGYTSASNTGPVTRDGKPFALTLYYDPAGSLGKSVADGIAAQCAAAGLTIVPTPNTNEVVTDGPWDLALVSGPGDLSLANRVARYTKGDASDIGVFFSGQLSPTVAQAAAAINEKDFLEALNVIDESLWFNVPSIPLYRAPSLAVTASNVSGVAATPGFAGLFASAHNWK